MTGIGEALEAREQPREQQTILALIERQKPAIERALPAAYLRRDPDRFVRTILTELRRTPKLLECSPETVLGAMMLAAQLGLETGPLGHAYLVPFKDKGKTVCTFVIGYTGFLALAWRSGIFKDVTVRTVHEGDHFRYREGLRPVFEYEDAEPSEQGATVCYAGLFRFRNGGHYQVRLWPNRIEAARKRSMLGRSNAGPWATDFEPMAHKTVVRASRPWLPMTAELGHAMAVDERASFWNGDAVAIPAEPALEALPPDDGSEG